MKSREETFFCWAHNQSGLVSFSYQSTAFDKILVEMLIEMARMWALYIIKVDKKIEKVLIKQFTVLKE